VLLVLTAFRRLAVMLLPSVFLTYLKTLCQVHYLTAVMNWEDPAAGTQENDEKPQSDLRPGFRTRDPFEYEAGVPTTFSRRVFKR